MEVQREFYQRSVLIKFGKKMLHYLNDIMPNWLYDKIYDVVFLIYRKFMRLYFGRHILFSWLANDEIKLKRAKTVYQVMPFSLVIEKGLFATYDVAVEAENKKIPGAFVECGVAQGGTSALLGLVIEQFQSERNLWMFDSYEGLPEPTEEDIHLGDTGTHARPLPPGSCLGTINEVRDLMFNTMKLDRTRIHMVKGWFEDTLEKHAGEIGQIGALRIDADWYESVKLCLNTLYKLVVPDGYVIVDDYGTCYGAQKAVDEFLKIRNIDVELVHDGRGGCHFIKPSE